MRTIFLKFLAGEKCRVHKSFLSVQVDTVLIALSKPESIS